MKVKTTITKPATPAVTMVTAIITTGVTTSVSTTIITTSVSTTIITMTVITTAITPAAYIPKATKTATAVGINTVSTGKRTARISTVGVTPVSETAISISTICVAAWGSERTAS